MVELLYACVAQDAMCKYANGGRGKDGKRFRPEYAIPSQQKPSEHHYLSILTILNSGLDFIAVGNDLVNILEIQKKRCGTE